MATQNVACQQAGVQSPAPELSTVFTYRRLRRKPLKWTGIQSLFCVTLQKDKGFVQFWLSLIFTTVSSITVTFVLCSIFC